MSEVRFGFGKNWISFLNHFDNEKLISAEESLKCYLNIKDFNGLTFLDIGSGSGLFSLAAKKLGAKSVISFDYDQNSVLATKSLKEKFHFSDQEWKVFQGSVLDSDFMQSFKNQADIVYSWGVLHHTGNMWQSFENVASIVKPSGKLYIAIYNDQGLISAYWANIKRLYNLSPLSKWLMILIHFPYLVIFRFLYRYLTKRSKLERGMNIWHDMLDWLGGYPFEVASINEVNNFFLLKGFELISVRSCGARLGCNEYLFLKK